MTLRERVTEIEKDTEEAFEKWRQLVKLLVERIDAGRGEYGGAQVHVTYRFDPPEASLEADISAGVQGSTSSTSTNTTTPAPASWPLSSLRSTAAEASVGP